MKKNSKSSHEEGTGLEADEVAAAGAAKNEGSAGGTGGKLRGRLELKATPASLGEAVQRPEPRPNLDRLTVGVDLGDQWSQYCILGLDGERLNEGQVGTTQADVAEFFRAIMPARVVIEVGTHSAWVQETSPAVNTRYWWPTRG